MNPAAGTWDGAWVTVAEPAAQQRLRKLGLGTVAATPHGAVLRLHPVEAAYAVQQGKLNVHDEGVLQDVADLVRDEKARNAFAVYRDLRERGLVARPTSTDAKDGGPAFDVWPRGTDTGNPSYRVVAVADDVPLDDATLLAAAQGQHVLAVVDVDGEVTHYRAEADDPRGQWTQPSETTPQQPARPAASSSGTFLQRVHADLTARHIAARSGLRYGSHLRAYKDEPGKEHADWLVHCSDGTMAWRDLAGSIRVAQNVRKAFLVALPDGARVRYIRLAWFRP